MIRVCVIGDSHTAPLVHAASCEGFPPIYDPVFFGFHTKYVPELDLAGRNLVPRTEELKKKLSMSSRGQEQIEIDQYDRFVVIGHNLSIGCVARYYRSFASDRMSKPTSKKYQLSDSCYAALAETRAMELESVRLAKLIRSVSDLPLTIVPCPNPSLGLSEAEIPAWYPPYHEIVRNADDHAVSSLFREVCDRLAKNLGVTVIPPMQEVAANGVFNKQEYCALPTNASPNLDAHQRMHLMVHASKSYGIHLAKYVFPPTDMATPLAEEKLVALAVA